MDISVNATLTPYWQTRVSLDARQASLSGLDLSEGDRLARAAASGFDTTTVYRHCTDELLGHYHTGQDAAGVAALCPFDPAQQGVFMAPATEADDALFYVRPGRTLLPLSHTPVNTLARQLAVEKLEQILYPWIDGDTLSVPGLPVIAPIREHRDWVHQLCHDQLPWSLFDHPEVITRARESGFDSVDTCDFDGERRLLILDVADCLPTHSAFGPFAGLPLASSRPAAEADTLYQSSHIKAIDKAADMLGPKCTGPVLNVWGLHFADGDEVAQWYNHGYLGDVATKHGERPFTSPMPMSLGKPELHLNGQATRIPELHEALEECLAAGKPTDHAALVQHFRDRASSIEMDQPTFLSDAGAQRTITRLRFLASVVDSATQYAVKVPHALMPSSGLPLIPPTVNQILNWDDSLYAQPDGVQAVFRDSKTGRLGDYQGLTGGEAYEKLALRLGGHEKASKKLTRKGIVGLCYRETSRTHADNWEKHFIIWDQRTVKPEHIAQQLEITQAIADRRAVRRASIAFRAEHFADVVLGTAADFSSLVHEGAHLFLEMYTDAATQDGATAAVQDDYLEMLAWLGVDDLTWRNMTIEQREPYHERFSETFEAYLATRQSPIENTHKDYAGWMGQVYQDVRQELPNAQLSPAATALFDKLILADAPPASSPVSEAVHKTVLAAAKAAGQPHEAAVVQATLYASAYDGLFQQLQWPDELFLTRYSLAITVASPDPTHTFSEIELSGVGPASLTYETGQHLPQR